MQIKRVADLKRIPVGTRLRLVRCLLGEVPADKQARTVAKVNSNTIEMALPDRTEHSYINIPKASNFRGDANGFTIFSPYDGNEGADEQARVVLAQYVFEG